MVDQLPKDGHQPIGLSKTLQKWIFGYVLLIFIIHYQIMSLFATLGSILDSQQSWKSSKSQLVRWSLKVALFWWSHPGTHTATQPATRSPSFLAVKQAYHPESWVTHLLIHPQYWQGVQNWFSKQEMELSKQEMELFLPLLDLWSKNLFYYICSKWTKDFKIDFQNKKWNHPNRKWNFFSTSRPLIKNLLLQHLLHITKGVQK